MRAAATGQKIVRIAKRSYGPMNPQLRDPSVDPDVSTWGRFDVANHRTIYGASPAEGAYGEALAVFRPAPDLADAALADLFDADDEMDPHGTVMEAAMGEWNDLVRFVPRFLPAGWRTERLRYEITLPDWGWFIDLEHASSLAAVGAALAGQLNSLGVRGRHLTVADLRGSNRRLTTEIAAWAWKQVLDDGSLPHGIVYSSKHDSDWRCWAVWLRKVDDGHPLSAEPTSADAGTAIDHVDKNPPMRHVAKLFGLDCF